MVRIRHQKIVSRHQVKSQYSYIWNYSKIIRGLKSILMKVHLTTWKSGESLVATLPRNSIFSKRKLKPLVRKCECESEKTERTKVAIRWIRFLA